MSWDEALEAVMADPGQPRLVFQPIVDLRRGVVAGYEALARFDGPPEAAPDVWFAHADRLQVGAQLEARVISAAVEALPDLPTDCFLTVNVSPHLLCEPVIADLLTSFADLSRLVLELTEHVPVPDYAQLATLLVRLRSSGVTIALDDAGSGYAGLQQLALIRPEMVKIDRVLVDHVDQDEVKIALAELLGAYSGRLDALLIAEGIERVEELEVFSRMGVPLAQGWLFGRPGPRWPALPAGVAARITTLAARTSQPDTLIALMQHTDTVDETDLDHVETRFAADPSLEHVAVLDRHQRILCLLRRPGRAGDSSSDIQVLPVNVKAGPHTSLADAATRAMTRPGSARFDPIAYQDHYGRYLGIIRIETLMLRLAAYYVHNSAHAAPAVPQLITGEPA